MMNESLLDQRSYLLGWRAGRESKIKEKEMEVNQSHRTCTWYLEEKYGQHFSTICDNIHFFSAGGIKDNGYDFCPYCGKKIEEVKDE